MGSCMKSYILPKEVTNITEFIQEVQRLDLLNHIFIYSQQINESDQKQNIDLEHIMNQEELSNLKKNNDLIYYKINLINKLLLLNQDIIYYDLEFLFKPMSRLEDIQKGVENLSNVLEKNNDLGFEYEKIDDASIEIKKHILELLTKSKEILKYNHKKDTIVKLENDNNVEIILKESHPNRQNQSDFLKKNKRTYKIFKRQFQEKIYEHYKEILDITKENIKRIGKYNIYNCKQMNQMLGGILEKKSIYMNSMK